VTDRESEPGEPTAYRLDELATLAAELGLTSDRVDTDRLDESGASAYAQAALEAAANEKSGFRYVQNLGLVGGKYPDLVQELRRIARSA
jgi:hypothetical protein